MLSYVTADAGGAPSCMPVTNDDTPHSPTSVIVDGNAASLTTPRTTSDDLHQAEESSTLGI